MAKPNKNKKLRLKPSLKENRRYLLVQTSDRKKTGQAVLDYIGVLGFAKSGFMIVKKSKTNLVVSCTRQSLEDVKASLAWKRIPVVKVSGTLKGLGV